MAEDTNLNEDSVETGLDTEAGISDAVDDIASSVLNVPQKDLNPEDTEEAAPVRPVPKSWAKETHELWGKIPSDAQEQIEKREKQMLEGLDQYKTDSGFGKQLREVFIPYKAMLQSQNIDEVKATQFLLNAHYKLTTSNPAEKQAYFSQLAKSYGIDLAGLPAQAVVDPAVKALQDKLEAMESKLTTGEQATLNEAKARVAKDVEAFAADKPYFDEVAQDIIAQINAGYDLKDAYERAVYANPVTRAKELARLQTESEKTLRTKAKSEAEAAKKAASTNVRGRDTNKAPTEPLGKMDDTLRETLREINSRTH